MFPLERQNKIIEILTLKKVQKLPELAEELNISIDTLRRDINLLDKQGKISKIYGGIKLVESEFAESPMDARMVGHIEEKGKIAQKCSEYIDNGDCIYLDSGSTTYHIAKYIKHKKNLTVITNSIPVVNELMNSAVELIIIGGKVRLNEQSVIAYDYLFNFSELNIRKAFICAGGITLEKGISDYNLEEAHTRKTIIDLSKEVYVAADHTKFGKDVTIAIAPLEKVDYIITDHNLDRGFQQKFKAKHTRLIVTEL